MAPQRLDASTDNGRRGPSTIGDFRAMFRDDILRGQQLCVFDPTSASLRGGVHRPLLRCPVSPQDTCRGYLHATYGAYLLPEDADLPLALQCVAEYQHFADARIAEATPMRFVDEALVAREFAEFLQPGAEGPASLLLRFAFLSALNLHMEHLADTMSEDYETFAARAFAEDAVYMEEELRIRSSLREREHAEGRRLFPQILQSLKRQALQREASPGGPHSYYRSNGFTATDEVFGKIAFVRPTSYVRAMVACRLDSSGRCLQPLADLKGVGHEPYVMVDAGRAMPVLKPMSMKKLAQPTHCSGLADLLELCWEYMVEKQVARVMRSETFQTLLQQWAHEFTLFKAGLYGELRESLDEIDALNQRVWRQYGVPLGEGGLPAQVSTVENYGILEFPGLYIGNHYGSGKRPAILVRQVQARQHTMKSSHEIGGKWLGSVVMSTIHAVTELLCIAMGGVSSLSFSGIDKTTFELTGNKYFMFNLQHDETRTRFMDFSHWTSIDFNELSSEISRFHKHVDADAGDHFPTGDVVTDERRIYARLREVVRFLEAYRGEGEVCSAENLDVDHHACVNLARENGFGISEATANQRAIMYKVRHGWEHVLWQRHDPNAAKSAWFHGHWVAIVDFAKHLLRKSREVDTSTTQNGSA